MAHRGEDLYEQHAQLVNRYLFSLCRDADLAEELCQETFCQAAHADAADPDKMDIDWFIKIDLIHNDTSY